MMKTIFVKYSNERSDEFAIRTAVCTENSQKIVVKTPCSEKAEKHVRNIYRWSQKLGKLYASGELKINRCRLSDNCVEMEFLEGETLEEILDGYVARKEYDKLEKTLDRYLRILKEAAREDFYPTEEFKQVFETVPPFEGLKTAAVTDIDMVLNNIIESEGWNLIDYEWTFEFPVPSEYVVYRVLHYYFETTGVRNAVLRERKIYERFGLPEERRAVYAEMERHFQQYILQGYEPLRKLYPKLTPGLIDVANQAKLYREQLIENIQVFWSSTRDMSEKDSRRFRSEDGKSVRCSMRFPEKTTCIRLDPGEKPCVVQIVRFCVNGREAAAERMTTNGTWLKKDVLLFEYPDPNVFFEEEDICTLELEWIVTPMADNMLETVKVLNQRSREQRQQLREEKEKAENLRKTVDEQKERIRLKDHALEEKQSLIREMENTKVWKMYRKYRRLREQKK